MLASVKVDQSKMDIQNGSQSDEVSELWKDPVMVQETSGDDISSLR